MIKKTIKGKIAKKPEKVTKKAVASIVLVSSATKCEQCNEIAFMDGKCLECGFCPEK